MVKLLNAAQLASLPTASTPFEARMSPDRVGFAEVVNMSPYLFELQDDAGIVRKVVSPFTQVVVPLRVTAQRLYLVPVAALGVNAAIVPANYAVYMDVTETRPEETSNLFSYVSGSVPAGSTIPQLQVGDTQQQNIETTLALGANGVFTGPWRNVTQYNWMGAVALSDVAGTLIIDEADASTPTVTNLVASQASAATPANQPTPPVAGQVARIVPTKTLLNFNRARYINGAGAQARFVLVSILSPLN